VACRGGLPSISSHLRNRSWLHAIPTTFIVGHHHSINMQVPTRRALLQGIALASLAIWGAMPACAHEYTARHFTLIHPWAYATPPGATTARVYFTIESVEEGDRLLGATADFADSCELRASLDDTARALDEVPVPVAELVDFSLGHPHVLIKGLRIPFQWDRSYPLTLKFEKAGNMTVQVSVGAH
jgi:copper(I)-binding protein